MSPPAPFSVVYDESIVKRACREYIQVLFGRAMWALAAAALGTLLCFFVGQTWFAILGAGVVTVVMLILGLTIFFLTRSSVRMVRDMGDGHAEFRLGEKLMESTSSLGRSEIPWDMIRTVHKRTDYWIVVYTNSASNIIPAKDIPPDAETYFDERVKAVGGVIRTR